jgi:hypothetical protein
MNDTKWDEVRLAMYKLGPLSPRWRTKDIESGYVPSWEREWFYHFRNGGYESIEWLEIALSSPEQEEAVICALKAIHVPGHRVMEGIRTYGYVEAGFPAAEYI